MDNAKMSTSGRYAVPAWLDPLLPDVVAPLLVDVVDGEGGAEFWGIAPDGGRRLLGTTLEDAYDAAGDVDVLFSDAVCERYGDGGSDGRFAMFSVPSRDGYHRLLFSHTDAHRVAALADAWTRFRERDAQWRADPSFLTAFGWIDAHPAFWIRAGRSEPGDPDWRDSAFWRWETGEHMQRIDIRPRVIDGGAVVIDLETGGHVDEDQRWDPETGESYVVEGVYRSHYHDPRLDVSALTFEEAVCRLAEVIDAVFDIDGSERPTAPEPVDILPADAAAELEDRAGSWARRPRVRFADLGTRAG